jgi:type I restriction enzyme S subunit
LQKLKEQYKKIELEEIPTGWRSLELQEITQEIYRYPTYYNIHYTVNGIPEIRGEMINKNGTIERDKIKFRYISPETSSKFSRTILKEGDFVMSVRGTIGKVAIIEKNLEGANITANLIRISPKHSIVFSPFLKYLFLSERFQTKLTNLSPQTTIKTIQAPLLKSINLLIPPMKEQQKIASILSKLDELIQKTDKIIDQTQRLKKGLLQLLLSKGIGLTKLKKVKSLFGVYTEIPEEWNIVDLRSLIEDIHYGTSVKCTTVSRGIPILRIPNVIKGTINLEDLKYAELSDQDLNRFILTEGDLIFVRTNGNPDYVGRCAVYHNLDGNHGFASYLIRVRIDIEKMNPHFLRLQLSLPMMKIQMRNHAKTSAGQYNINTEGLKSLKVVVPPLQIQNKITSIISSIENVEEIYRHEKTHAGNMKKSIMQKILTGKIRVKD